MKRFIAIFLFLFTGVYSGLAQDTTLLLTGKMFESFQRIPLGDLDGWVFKKGNDPASANKEINTSDWMPLKPAKLSAKYAGKDGKAEGWFRLKFKLEDAFGDMPFGLVRGGWAATDIYLDGNFVGSFGSTGVVFKEYNPIDKPSLPVDLRPGKEHLLALHVVDYVSPIPPRQLKSETRGGARFVTYEGPRDFVLLTGPEFNSSMQQFSLRTLKNRTLWLSVTAILALLFWLLVVQNPGERKILLLIAVYSSFSMLSNLCRFFFTDPDSSFLLFRIAELVYRLSFWIDFLMTFIIVTTVINFRVPLKWKSFLIALTVLAGLSIFFDFLEPFWYLFGLTVVLICGFILIFSWKKLRGAHWAVAAGLSVSLFLSAVLNITLLIGAPSSLLILTGYYLLFPVSLLVYVSLRFREIIGEVRENARQVVRMTEERKEEAVKQQRVLEEEVARQTAELRATLDNLKATQSQLVQSEKMASLGELTAGIAHEIQNPLNFVNNFSDVNAELIDEAGQEIEKGDLSGIKTILNTIKDNEEKINHHGKRADAIVKSMLQHSRAGSGQRELTDINALGDEYVRLAYHGLRAKDKSFNAKFETNFEPGLEKISVVPQDIGRVILNLLNNAFYAVTEKKRSGVEGYEPTVTISTAKQNGKIEIRVRDNGNGIPPKIADKIFQPFFTTKPTGQGTGLGLSLAYDIITKGHGGELKVKTKEGEGSEFVIQLPAV